MADIELSSQLFHDIQTAVQRQHPGANPTVVLQYLAAVMGYMLGSQRGVPAGERDELMDELCGFARHVYQDLARHSEPPPHQPGAQAFGYWRPPKK